MSFVDKILKLEFEDTDCCETNFVIYVKNPTAEKIIELRHYCSQNDKLNKKQIKEFIEQNFELYDMDFYSQTILY